MIPFIVALALLFAVSPGWQTFFISVIFLQLAHTSLTYLMLAYLPEFHSWRGALARRSGPRTRLTWVISVGLVVAFVLIFRAGPYLSEVFRSEASALMLAWVVALLQYQHFFAQSLGIQAIYDESLRRSGGEPVSAPSKKRERFLLGLLFWWGVFQVFGFPILRIGLRAFGQLSWFPELEIWQNVSGRLLFAPVLFILANTAFGAQGFFSAKIVYQLRLFFWPLSFIDPKYGLVLIAVHSVEYVLLTRQMVNNSAASTLVKQKFWSRVLPVFLIFTMIGLPGSVLLFEEAKPVFVEYRGLVTLLGSFALFLSFYHYYLDAYLFRMRDPEVRRLIGPLVGERR